MSLTQYATPAEARVARKLVREALERGYAVSVNDGIDGDGEWVVRRSRSMREICGALASTGGDIVRLTNADGARFSFVLIWGNASDGSELIADHSDKAEADQIFRAVYP